jgi:hypothetical protein
MNEYDNIKLNMKIIRHFCYALQNLKIVHYPEDNYDYEGSGVKLFTDLKTKDRQIILQLRNGENNELDKHTTNN